MPGFDIDLELLRAFEEGLNPRHPERSVIPPSVLGFGEISTVLAMGEDYAGALAYKRLPMFRTPQEAEAYRALHAQYVGVLRDRIGIPVVPCETVRLDSEGRSTVYIIQERLPRQAIGHQAIHLLRPDDIQRLILAVLRQTSKVFAFNSDALAVGFDAQISNWAILSFDPQAPLLEDEPSLVYFDTSAPLLRRQGVEQLNPDLFLRSAPSFLVWMIRLLFLEDVMTRYYDGHGVVIDLIANFHKEQRAELIPALVDAANRFFSAQIENGSLDPFSTKAVRAYYREDAWIWRVYLVARKIDRALHAALGQPYPYMLPGRIKR
ncbi:MAG: DUF6206 family protein [Anaerolineae bacterium]|jgi:hypothetical protein